MKYLTDYLYFLADLSFLFKVSSAYELKKTFYSTMVATTEKKAAATDKKAAAEKKPVKGKEDSKKLPAVPESVLKHRKRREALRTRRLQVPPQPLELEKISIGPFLSFCYTY